MFFISYYDKHYLVFLIFSIFFLCVCVGGGLIKELTKMYERQILNTKHNKHNKMTLNFFALKQLMLTGRTLGRVFNSKFGRTCIRRSIAYIRKQPNLKLKTQYRQFLSYLLLAFALSVQHPLKGFNLQTFCWLCFFTHLVINLFIENEMN
jgi:hypothetical protein